MKRILPFFVLLLTSLPGHAQKISLAPGTAGAGVTFGACSDAYAATRVAPSGFPTLPILPTCVVSPANVMLNTTLDAAYKATYPAVMSGGYVIVDTVSGSDTTCAAGTTPVAGIQCATISKALRSTTATQVYVKCPASGVVTLSGTTALDYRFTDTGAGAPKLLYSQTPGCKLRYTGDAIGTNTWTATAGHPGVYQTTIASAAAGTSGAVSMVLYADGTTDGSGYVDEWGNGFPKRLQSVLPNQWDKSITYHTGDYIWTGSYACYQATANNSNSAPPSANWSSCGDVRTVDTFILPSLDRMAAATVPAWGYSVSTHTAYVYFGGQDLTNPTNAAKLQARYFPAGQNYGSGVNPRLFVYGATLLVEGFYLDGIGVETSQYNNSGTYVNPTVYEQNDTIFGSMSYGSLVRGANVYALNVAAHANYFDGWNGDLGTDGTTYSTMELVNVWSTQNGDPESYNSNVIPNEAPNNNGVSSHNGYAAYIGSVFENNTGPDVADTSATSSSPVIPSKTWVVGSIANNATSLETGNIGGFQFQGVSPGTLGDSRNRSFWIDSSSGYNESTFPLSVLFYANCKTYHNTFDQAIYFNPTSTCTNYTPDAP